jgi:hypothetical protein
MKYRFLGLALVLGLGRTPLAMAATPCVDLQDMVCRDQFIEDNLPLHPHKPDEKDLQDPKIQALDKDLNSLLKEIKDLRIEETVARYAVMHARTGEDRAKTAKDQLAVQKTLYDDCNRAIADAKTLYHLTPKIVDPISHGDPSVPSPTKAWLPHYGEFDLQGQELNETSNMAAGTSIKTAYLTLFPGSFVSKENLVAQIYHETVHWLNDNALGREPTPYEDYKNEVLAYDKEMKAGPDLGLSDGQLQTLKSHQARYLEYLKHVGPNETWQHLRIDHPDYSLSGSIGAPADSSDDAGNPEPTRASGDDSFNEGVGRAKEDIEKERKKQENKEEYGSGYANDATFFERIAEIDSDVSAVNRTAFEDDARREKNERLEREIVAKSNSPWEALYQWAGVACLYMIPGSPGDDELVYLRTHYVVLPRSEIDAGLKTDKRLDSCDRSVIKMARDASDPVNIDWMIKQMTYRKGGGLFGVVVRGIGATIESAPGALVQGILAPLVFVGTVADSVGNASPDTPNHTGRENTPSNGRSVQYAPDNWSSLNQLRGFAR